MREVFIERGKDQTRQTLGGLKIQDVDFSCKTLELAWRNNENNVSCIPVNTEENPFYLCKYTRSPRMSKEALERWLKKNPTLTETDCPEDEKNVYTYEVLGVPGRAGIRIHPANYARQLLGCIALGDESKDLDLDGQNDVLHSGNTCKKFVEIMNKEDFHLIIKNAA